MRLCHSYFWRFTCRLSVNITWLLCPHLKPFASLLSHLPFWWSRYIYTRLRRWKLLVTLSTTFTLLFTDSLRKYFIIFLNVLLICFIIGKNDFNLFSSGSIYIIPSQACMFWWLLGPSCFYTSLIWTKLFSKLEIWVYFIVIHCCLFLNNYNNLYNNLYFLFLYINI